MTNPIGDWPDFTRAILIVGKDADGNPVGVYVDASGFLAAILKGQKPDTTLATVALDASGRIVMVPYGTTTVEGTATVTQAEKDREIQGADGATLRTVSVDADGQMIMVPRGQSGNYMLVDSDGFLTAVLKGAYAGALHTMAVDEKGRLEAFVLDGEDQWGQTLRIGNSELVARLGSPVSWDWRGNTLLINTFGQGMGCIYTYHAGTGSSVAIDPTRFMTDGYSLLCLGGNAAGDYAGFDGRLGLNPAGRYGYELAWDQNGNFGYWLIALRVKGAGSEYVGRIKWIRTNGYLYYQDSDGNYQYVDTRYNSAGDYLFNRVKLVVDLTSAKYLRLLWNSVEYDLSGFALYPTSGLAAGTLEYQFRVYPDAAPQTGVYIDHFVITVNEPA